MASWKLTFPVVASLLFAVSHSLPLIEELPPPCPSEIYCHGNLLHTVQLAGLFHDSKTFVDKKLKSPPQEVLGNFSSLMQATNGQPSKEQLALLVANHFDPEGSEFESWDPSDWKSNPAFLENIDDVELRTWASELNKAWKFLGRKIKDDVRVNPELYSMIYVPNPVIVPGGRFREFYYWDSYWIVQGLLLSEMNSTVKGMLENFLLMVERYGMVPNGGRIYYENRSQPPLLIPMIERYYNVTGDLQFIKDNIGLMEREMQFWLHNRTVEVNGCVLARYNVEAGGPRPESYKEDFHDSANMTADDREEFYMNMKAGAESGWDFSTRWFMRTENLTIKANLTHIRTRYIVPVDLNAFICMNARILSEMFTLLEDTAKAEYYQDLFKTWKTSMNTILWNEEAGAWFDFDLMTQEQRDVFYPSNIAPLWAGCWDPLTPNGNSTVDKVLQYLIGTQALNFPGGVPTSMQHSGQQWDYPNGWPPLQHMLIFALEAMNHPKASELALDLTRKWVSNNYEAYIQSMPNAMFEKYDVTVVGLPGGGGEYDVQLGFGWTNGVIMELLDKYGDKLSSSTELKGRNDEDVVVNLVDVDAVGATLLAGWIGPDEILP